MEKSTDPAEIKAMFDRLAARYDLFNQWTSLGMDTRWRREALKPLKPGMRMLDLGCGTGDLALEAALRMDGKAEIAALDFSEKMIGAAERRADKLGLQGARRPLFLIGDAQDLPGQEKPFDLVVSGFVLRNLHRNIDPILKAVHRSLKPGGTIRFLDFTEPPNALVRAGWRFYVDRVVHLYGRAIFGKDYPAHYLAESAKRFFKPAEFVRRLEAAGFEGARAETFLFGSIALYTARRAPAVSPVEAANGGRIWVP